MANVINATSTGNGGLVSTGDDSGILNIQTNETTAITVDASQNVGIGTTSPTSPLEIKNSTVGQVLTLTSVASNIYGVASDGTISAYTGGVLTGTGGFVGTSSAHPYIFRTSNTERMRIDSSGVVMVGKTTSNNTSNGFQIQQSGAELSVNRSGDRCAIFGRNTNDGAIVAFFKDGSTVGSISVSGSNVAYNTSSDYRLKENITPMTGALAKVALLKPVTYKWKVDGSDGEGFIAHELAEVVPQCVLGEKDAVETYTDEDGNEATRPVHQGIDVSFLVATLTAAIQELKAINDTQAETINALTARIVALEGQ